jgi:hypothetical protein
MKIAVTGGSGRRGNSLIKQLLEHGHTVRNLDRVPPQAPPAPGAKVRFVQVDLTNLPAVTEAFAGCDAVAHLAAYPGPHFEPPGIVYSNNTISSYNVLRAALTLGIKRLCLASSINAIGGVGSRAGRFDYFPVDEKHPTYSEDDYSLGKWVMEQQADSFARRCPNMTIDNCVITDCNRGIAFMSFDGGSVENVVLANLTIECRRFDWFWWGDGDPQRAEPGDGRPLRPAGAQPQRRSRGGHRGACHLGSAVSASGRP